MKLALNRERIRKTLILLALVAMLLPTFVVNIGDNAEQVSWAAPLRQLNRPPPSLQALLLCQQWTLFSEISPFNFKLHYVVELQNGDQILLHDLDKDRAGKLAPLLFYNEPKAELNLYSDPAGQRRYLEYLVRTNEIDPDTIATRFVLVIYQDVYSREQFAKTGSHYGPDSFYVLSTY
jgi:NAD(P)-dependent dehydrogenase (short-subunit alcohol dehydrogenase family)